MVERLKPSLIRAGGGVLWRTAKRGKNGRNLEVAVIHRPRYDDWTIPKGKLVPGESDLEGAIREVMEETGFRVYVRRPLGEVAYEKTVGRETRTKVVRYWSMEARGGAFSPGREVDELRWLDIDGALDTLTQERDRKLVRSFAEGPIHTRSVLLVRHGSAGDSSSWSGDDDLRPLDETGEVQAEGLVWLLTRFRVGEVISAPPLRCLQSVEPLAEAVGLEITEEKVVSENGYYGHEGKAAKLLRKAASDGEAAVICSQGGVIPDLLKRLATEDGFDLPHPVVAKKGSVWSLTFAGDKLLAAEYFPPMA